MNVHFIWQGRFWDIISGGLWESLVFLGFSETFRKLSRNSEISESFLKSFKMRCMD